MIITYIGNGDGKTTAALGHVVRALGYGKKAAILQFMKGRITGEYKFFKKAKNVDIHLCGPPTFLKKKEDIPNHLSKAREGMKLAKKIITSKKYDIIVLDEILTAVSCNLVKEKELLELVQNKKNHIILTGKKASRKIIKISDMVSKVTAIKHHFKKDKKTIKIIDY